MRKGEGWGHSRLRSSNRGGGCANCSTAVATTIEVVVAGRRLRKEDLFPSSPNVIIEVVCVQDSDVVTSDQGADVAGRHLLKYFVPFFIKRRNRERLCKQKFCGHSFTGNRGR